MMPQQFQQLRPSLAFPGNARVLLGAVTVGRRVPGPHAWPAAPPFFHREGSRRREAATMDDATNGAGAEWVSLYDALERFTDPELWARAKTYEPSPAELAAYRAEEAQRAADAAAKARRNRHSEHWPDGDRQAEYFESGLPPGGQSRAPDALRQRERQAAAEKVKQAFWHRLAAGELEATGMQAGGFARTPIPAEAWPLLVVQSWKAGSVASDAPEVKFSRVQIRLGNL